MKLCPIARPPNPLRGVPQHLLGAQPAHEEGMIGGVRCVLDWFWSDVQDCIAIRVVQMQTGKVLWFTPVSSSPPAPEVI